MPDLPTAKARKPRADKGRKREKDTRKSLADDFDSVAGSASLESGQPPHVGEAEDEMSDKKRRPTVWQRLRSWDTSLHTQSEILEMCSELAKARLRSAGIPKLPATHKPKVTDLGFWKFKEPTTTEKGACLTHYYRCPLAHRTGCPHKIRVLYYAGVVHFEGTEGHSDFNHVDQNEKILSWRQVNAIADAVRVAPNQAASSIRRNLGNFNSPTKEVVPSLLPAVRRLVKRERDDLTRVHLAGIEVDGSYGSLSQLCRAIDFRTLVARHNEPSDDFHADLFQTVCIGHDIDGGSNVIFIALTNIWMLCEILAQHSEDQKLAVGTADTR